MGERASRTPIFCGGSVRAASRQGVPFAIPVPRGSGRHISGSDVPSPGARNRTPGRPGTLALGMHCSNARTTLRYPRDDEPCRDRAVSVGESSDDNLRSTRPEPFVHPEAWIEAFDEQCTETLLKRLRRYAFLLARVPGGEHLGDAISYAEEQVQAAVTDLLGGVLRWDPSTTDLEPYLMDVIRLRARRDRKRAARFKHVSIDATPSSNPGMPVREIELRLAVSASVHADELEASSLSSIAHTMRQLRGFFSADPLAQRFLDAIDSDATTRSEIMKVAGLTRDEYHNTRRRIARYLAQPDHGRNPRGKDN